MFNAAWIYVGAVYAAAVWLARRAGVDLPRRVATLFYLLVLLFLFRPLTGPWVSFSTDVIELVPPWSVGSNLTKYTVSNPQLPDVTMQMVPWAHQVREAWSAGRLPLWNPLVECGMPLAGNGQSSAFSPFRILALPLPLGYAITAEAAMKFLTALTFTFLFCRRRGMSYGASVIAAVSYAFSLFMTVWLHFTQATVAAFLPAVFYGVDLLAEKVNAKRFAVVTVLWAASLLGGHTETSAHIAIFAAMYALWKLLLPPAGEGGPEGRMRVNESRGNMTPSPGASRLPLPQAGEGSRIRFLLAISAAAAVTALLASPLLVAMGQAIVRSMRFQYLRVRPYDFVPFSDIASLFLLIQPRVFGALPKGEWASYPHAESISGFAGILGFAALIGVIVALITRRMPWRSHEAFFSFGWLIALFAIADVGPVTRFLHALAPYTAHARYRLLLCWFAALLAGVLVDRVRDARTRGPFVAGLSCAAIVLATVFLYIGFPNDAVRNAALLTSLPALAVLTLAFFWRTLVPLTIAVIVELMIPALPWNPVMPVESMYPETPMIRELRARATGDRFVGIGGTLFPNLNAIFGLEDVRVLDALALDRFMGVLRVATDYDTSEYYAKLKDPESPLLDFLNVRWVATEPGVTAKRLDLVYDGKDGRVFENSHVLPRFFSVLNGVSVRDAQELADRLRAQTEWRTTAFVEGESIQSVPAAVTIERKGPADFLLDIRAPQRTLIVSSQTLWPGWRIESDGKRIDPVRVNGAFLGFVAPQGNSVVRVRYFPTAVYGAIALSIATLAALVAAVLRTKNG